MSKMFALLACLACMSDGWKERTSVQHLQSFPTAGSAGTLKVADSTAGAGNELSHLKVLAMLFMAFNPAAAPDSSVSATPPFDVTVYQSLLKTRLIGRRIDCHVSTSSTMTLADERLRTEGAAAAHGSIILAETQTGGIGRRGRSWISPAGNLYFSLLWSPAVHLGGEVSGMAALLPQLSQLNLAAGVAVVHATKVVGLGSIAKIKWPNDVWAGEPMPRKMSGMLLNFDGKDGVVLGVGINVAQDLSSNATATSLASLREEIMPPDNRPEPISREAVLAAFCAELERLMSLPIHAVLDEYREHDLLRGRTVRVHHRTREEVDPKDFDAEVLGVTAQGHLRVRPLSSMSEERELSGEEVSISPLDLSKPLKENV